MRDDDSDASVFMPNSSLSKGYECDFREKIFQETSVWVILITFFTPFMIFSNFFLFLYKKGDQNKVEKNDFTL